MIAFSESLTITVRSLHAQADGAEVALSILLENGERREERRLVLLTEQYCELKPVRGVIDEAYFEQLEAAATLSRALRAGESLLAYGSNTREGLVRKLVQRGYSREVAARAVERLQEMGLIDEERDLVRETEKCLRKLWGAKRIRAHLWSRGFGVDAMAGLDGLLETYDFAAMCAALIQQRFGGVPDDPDEQKRLIASLSRYGYSLGEIRDAMKKCRG